MIPEETLNEIKARVRLSEVVGRHVRLKRVGKDFVGLSPFSNEKTPSFRVHDDRGFYKCFSTQKSGDVFTFLMEVERLSFLDAVRKLAEDVGVEIEAPSEDQRAAAYHRNKLLRIMGLAQEHFQRALASDRDLLRLKEAREYLRSRGYGLDRCQAVGIGWSASEILEWADRQNIPRSLLVECGLARHTDDGGTAPFFRYRITFPIKDQGGRIIGFGARAVPSERVPDPQPKFLNSPATILFDKGAALYGIDAAQRLLAKGSSPSVVGSLHVVEGYMDVLAMHDSEIPAVAPLGTAITVAHLEKAWRLVECPVLCFDGDRAGVNAARRAAFMALEITRPGRNLAFCFLPSGEDPDSVWRKGGQTALRRACAPTRSHFATIWEALAVGIVLTDPSDRLRLRAKIRELLATMKSEDARASWAAAFNVKMRETAPPPKVETKRKDKRQAVSRELSRAAGRTIQEPGATALFLLRTLWADPARVERHRETLAGLPCGELAPIRDHLLGLEEDVVPTASPEVVALVERWGMPENARGRYNPEGWERAAKAHSARWGGS